MSDEIVLDGITVDSPDPQRLAAFYAALTGGTVVGHERWAAVTGAGRGLSFQYSDAPRPAWPESTALALHLDFLVGDRQAAGRRVVAAGGVLAAVQPNDDHCSVYLDPDGHPFCLTTWAMDDLTAPDPDAGASA